MGLLQGGVTDASDNELLALVTPTILKKTGSYEDQYH